MPVTHKAAHTVLDPDNKARLTVAEYEEEHDVTSITIKPTSDGAKAIIIRDVDDTTDVLVIDENGKFTDIDIGANLLKTTNLAFKEFDSTHFSIRNADDNDFRSMFIDNLDFEVLQPLNNTGNVIRTRNSDDSNVIFQARDNGDVLVEVGRLQGAADPTFNFLRGKLTGAFDVNSQVVKGYRVLTSAPALADLEVGEIVIGEVGNAGTDGRIWIKPNSSEIFEFQSAVRIT